jgi:hypothetical protein
MLWLIGAAMAGGLGVIAARQQRRRRNQPGGFTIDQYRSEFDRRF